MEGWRAAKYANLDLWEWDNFRFPKSFRAKVIAFYRLDNMISSHSQEAAQAKKN